MLVATEYWKVYILTASLKILHPAYSFSNTLYNVPIWGRISTANSSPAFKVTFGCRTMPTPAGVPVMISVPAGKVVPCDMKLMIFAMLKIRSL